MDLNGTAAATRAGYSPKTAARQAVELLHKPHVQARIQELMAARSVRTQIEADDVVEKLWLAADFDICELFDEKDRLRATRQFDPRIRRLVSRIRTRELPGKGKKGGGRLVDVVMPDRLNALKLLGQHLRMFTRTHEIKLSADEYRERVAAGRRRARRKHADTEGSPVPSARPLKGSA